MLRRSLLLLLVLPLMLMLTAARKAELTDPGPIAIPAGLEEKEIVTAIKSSLIARTWTVGKSSPGRIDATLNIRAHRADISITYDQENVRISYVSSENLDYKQKKGKTLIHSNYIGWINNLTADISRNMQQMSMD
jgi:hypothetical protein